MTENKDFEYVEALNDEDLMATSFAFTNKTKKATECGSSCVDSCCC